MSRSRVMNMPRDQREATVRHTRNVAGLQWWQAQAAAERGDHIRAASLMRASDGLRAQADRLESTL